MAVAAEAGGAAAAVIGRAGIGVAASKVGLARRPRVGVVVVVGGIDADACRELVLPAAVAVAYVGGAGSLYALCRHRLEVGHAAVHEHAAALVVQVVQVGVQRQLVHACPPAGHQFQPVAVVGACAGLDVAEGADGVLLLQTHVHHVALVVHVALHHLRELAFAVEHLDLVHRVGRQVLERCLGVALEEVAAVDQQVVNLLAVHLDLAVLVQLGAWQLAYQGIEHRPLGQVEGVGIVDDGVATHHHLDFRPRNRHLS